MSRLAEAFKQMVAVVRPRSGQTDGDIEAGVSRLFRTLNEYPEAAALEALDQWPRQSDFLPTERELRALCSEIASEHELRAAGKGGSSGGCFFAPTDKTAAFVERAERVMGDRFVKAWLAGGVNCVFSADTIYTTGPGADRLMRECWSLLQAAGVSVVVSETASRMLRDHCDKRGAEFDPKRRRA